MTCRHLLLFLFCLASLNAHGQKDTVRTSDSTGLHGTLQEMVVTGTVQPVKLQNALAQYRIITAEDIRMHGAVTLADALTTQLNINIGSDNILGSTVQMQGLDGDKVKLLIDGLPVNGRQNGNIDFSEINLNNVDHIEIVQGPMSVVYGSDALGGVINIITKKKTKPMEASAGFHYESIGKYNVDGSVGKRFGKRHQLLLSGGRNFSYGWGSKDTAYPKRAVLFNPKEQYFANLAYTYTAPSGFALTIASDFLQEKIIDRGTAVYNSFEAYAYDSYYYTTRSNNRAQLSGKLGHNGIWTLDNSYAWYHRRDEKVDKDLVNLNETLTAASGDQDTSIFQDVTLRSNYSNHIGSLRYDGGYDVLLQYAHTNEFDTAAPNHNESSYALYANGAMSFLHDKLTAQLGLRGSYNNQFAVPLIYALNLLYAPVTRLQLRASLAKGFRAPSLKEQYLSFHDVNHDIDGNPALLPERSIHAQASASWQYKTAGALKGQLMLTGYYNDLRNEITLAIPKDSLLNNPNTVSRVYANLARQRNAIINLQADAEVHHFYLSAGAGITHTFSEEADSGGYSAFDYYEVTATGSYSWKAAGIRITAFYKYTGEAPQLAQIADGYARYTGGSVPSYNILDASLERHFFSSRISLTAGVKNIFDVRSVFAAGAINPGPHGDDGGTYFLPRRIFTTLRVML